MGMILVFLIPALYFPLGLPIFIVLAMVWGGAVWIFREYYPKLFLGAKGRKLDVDIPSLIDQIKKRDDGKMWGIRMWKRAVFIAPFSFRTIWWWTLIFGLLIISAQYMGKLDITGNLNEEEFLNFASQFAATVVVSVLAYIATNIIRELIQIRDDYSELRLEYNKTTQSSQSMLDNALVLRDEFHESGTRLQRSSRAAEETLKRSLEVIFGGTTLLKFYDRFDQRSSAAKNQRVLFIENLTKSIENFLVQMEAPGEDQRVELFLVTALNEYLAGLTKELDTEKKHLITRLENLGSIAQSLVRLSADGQHPIELPEGYQIEYYALYVLPPERWFNYENKLSIGPQNWERYLEGNIEAAKAKVIQKRYFLSLDLTQEEQNVLNFIEAFSKQDTASVVRTPVHTMLIKAWEEISEIHSKNVKEQLKKYVRINETTGIPDKVRILSNEATGEVVKEYKDNDRENIKYDIRDTRDPKNTWKLLGEVLSNIYHSSCCCFVREYKFGDYAQALADPDFNKLVDYYAIGFRKIESSETDDVNNSGKRIPNKKDAEDFEWKICLKTRYDKTFDVAEIRILHGPDNEALGKDWNDVQKELNRIFFNTNDEGRIVPIEDY